MDLFDIDSFLMIAEKKNMSAAAEMLSITQPALSQRIKSLERELGYTLLMRKKGTRCVELTEAGEIFVNSAMRIQEAWNDALSLAPEMAKKRLSVSITDSVAVPTLSSANWIFKQEHDDVVISVRSYRSSESLSYVESGCLDLAITGAVEAKSKNLKILPLYSEARMFVCQKDADYPETVHPSILDSRKQLMLTCNLETTEWQNRWFPDIQVPASSHITYDKIPYMDGWLFDDNAWAILPASVALLMEKTAGVSTRSMMEGPPPRVVYTIQRADDESVIIYDYLACVQRVIANNPLLTPLYPVI